MSNLYKCDLSNLFMLLRGPSKHTRTYENYQKADRQLKSNKQSNFIQMHRSSCWARPISPEQSGITGTRKLTSGKRRQHRDAADRPTFRRPTSVFLNTIRLKFCKRYSCLLCCHVLKPSVIRWIFNFLVVRLVHEGACEGR